MPLMRILTVLLLSLLSLPSHGQLLSVTDSTANLEWGACNRTSRPEGRYYQLNANNGASTSIVPNNEDAGRVTGTLTGLDAWTTYSVTVQCFDTPAVGAIERPGLTYTFTTFETVGPPAAENVRTTDVQEDEFTIAWDAPTTPSTIATLIAYKIFIGGIEVTQVANTTFSYRFTVQPSFDPDNMTFVDDLPVPTWIPIEGDEAYIVQVRAVYNFTNGQTDLNGLWAESTLCRPDSPVSEYPNGCDRLMVVTDAATIVADTTAPVITLVGADPLNLNQGDVFSDPGATCLDDTDGQIDGNVVATGTVDTSTPGAYVRSYNCADATGNAATQVSRDINVAALDTTAPVITLTGANPQLIALNTAYTELGATWTDNVDGSGSVATIDASAVNSSAVGSYSVTYNHADAAGNNAVQVTRTVTYFDPSALAVDAFGNTCDDEPGLAGRTDILKCEEFDTANWYTTGGYVDGTGLTPSAPTSAQMTRTRIINNSDCPSGTAPCLQGDWDVNVERTLSLVWAVDSAHAADNSFTEEPEELFFRYESKFYNGWDALQNSGSEPNGKLWGLVDAREADDPGGQCGNGGSTPDGTDCWSARGLFWYCEDQPADWAPGATCNDIAGGLARIGNYIYATGNGGESTGANGQGDGYGENQTRGDNGGSETTCRRSGPPGTPEHVAACYGTPYNNFYAGLGAGNNVIVADAWDTIEQQVKMNTVGQDDGILRLWVNDVLVYEKLNMRWRVAGHDNLHVRSLWLDWYKGGVGGNTNFGQTLADNLVVCQNSRCGVRQVGPDTTAPVVTLTGADPFNVTQNTTFTDPGATCADNVDGQIDGSVVQAGTVDTSTLGNYTRTYDCQDAAGNDAVQVTRTVSVVAAGDTTAPVITITGDNPLSVTQNTPFTDPGATCLDDTDGQIDGSVVAAGTVDTSTVGAYSRTYDCQDAAGNDATQLTRTVDVVAAGGDIIDQMAPGTWLEIPNSKMETVDPCPTEDCVYSNNSGFGYITVAWSGAAFDTTRDELIVFGGGHSDYGGNELVGFDLQTMQWRIISPPSTNVDSTNSNVGEYPDGTPSSTHSYGTIQYSAVTDSFYALGIASTWTQSNASNMMWEYDLANGGWSRATDMPAVSSYIASTAVDTITGDIWHMRGANGGLRRYTPGSDSWTSPGNLTGVIHQNAAMDSAEKVILKMGRNNVWAIDVSNPASPSEESLNSNSNYTGSDSFNLDQDDGPGLIYHPNIDKFVWWAPRAGSSVYLIDPTTKVIEERVADAANTVTPVDGTPASIGTYGRFRYSPNRNVIVLVTATDTNVYIYKLDESL